MAGRKPLVAGNWKMNGSRASALSLIGGICERSAMAAGGSGASGGAFGGVVDCLVCPPFPYLSMAADALAGSGIALGAQDVAAQSAGAFTGAVDADMLTDSGCAYTLIGHSERRALFGDTDEVVALKLARALRAGLQAVICVGETLGEREAGETEAVIARQLAAVAPIIASGAPDAVVIAYEPVWAIGTGKTASPDMAQQVHAYIRSYLAGQGVGSAQALRLLYGGSVKPANAAELFAQPDIDGGLIGGASLVVDDFAAICEAAMTVAQGAS